MKCGDSSAAPIRAAVEDLRRRADLLIELGTRATRFQRCGGSTSTPRVSATALALWHT